jgi:thiamine biosynthesis protein ThiI
LVKFRAVALISGGIDSPVATYLMLNQSVEVIALHMDNRPFTDEKQVNKAIDLIAHLATITKKSIKVYIVPHGDIQLAIARNCNRHLQCVLCRRMMFRVAERIANCEQASTIVTGESLGQVASQTLKNIRVETQAIHIPILRPLIGFDKIDIEQIARVIGTYEISTRPGVCCTIVPTKPATYASIARVLTEEQKLNLESLISSAINSARVIWK